jgi:acetylornithine deacetylase/succinyl-diaminopimelate desuccinylase-like protein
MQINIATKTIDRLWDKSIIPTMSDYIKIPNKSPSFDKDWQKNGHMDQAVKLLKKWCESQPIKGMTTEVIQIDGRTPLLFIEIKGNSDGKVLLYGHYDKQPEFTGWRHDLGPWKPVVEDGKLYGRGSADDGYALFSYLTAFRILQEQNIPHANCVIVLEGCEESGSYDLPFYMEKLKHKIDSPSLVVCLDAECGNYDQLWCTSSLRGNLVGV